jgi:capsular polysaccharide biosynthesis protein
VLSFNNKDTTVDRHCNFLSGTTYISATHGPISLIFRNQVEDSCTVFEAVESERTVLIYIKMEFYHFVIDVLAPIIREHKNNNNTNFVFLVKDLKTLTRHSYSRFFEEFLKTHNIKYSIVDSSKTDYVKLTNGFFYAANEFSTTVDDASINFLEYFSNFINNKDIKPFRKVYLSRSKVTRHDSISLFHDQDPNNFLFNDDERVDNEQEVEKFLISNGYEIVYPESINNFVDQINLIYETKELVSLTGSGLVNMMFMQPKQRVVELTTPIVTNALLSLHQFYYEIAYISSHVYTSIPHKRSQEEIKSMLNTHWLQEK